MEKKEEIIEVLKKVNDPEIHIDVWTLKLIYNIDIKEEIVEIRMTFTSPMCLISWHKSQRAINLLSLCMFLLLSNSQTSWQFNLPEVPQISHLCPAIL